MYTVKERKEKKAKKANVEPFPFTITKFDCKLETFYFVYFRLSQFIAVSYLFWWKDWKLGQLLWISGQLQLHRDAQRWSQGCLTMTESL
jgi:hypothetical protein